MNFPPFSNPPTPEPGDGLDSTIPPPDDTDAEARIATLNELLYQVFCAPPDSSGSDDAPPVTQALEAVLAFPPDPSGSDDAAPVTQGVKAAFAFPPNPSGSGHAPPWARIAGAVLAAPLVWGSAPVEVPALEAMPNQSTSSAFQLLPTLMYTKQDKFVWIDRQSELLMDYDGRDQNGRARLTPLCVVDDHNQGPLIRMDLQLPEGGTRTLWLTYKGGNGQLIGNSHQTQPWVLSGELLMAKGEDDKIVGFHPKEHYYLLGTVRDVIPLVFTKSRNPELHKQLPKEPILAERLLRALQPEVELRNLLWGRLDVVPTLLEELSRPELGFVDPDRSAVDAVALLDVAMPGIWYSTDLLKSFLLHVQKRSGEGLAAVRQGALVTTLEYAIKHGTKPPQSQDPYLLKYVQVDASLRAAAKDGVLPTYIFRGRAEVKDLVLTRARALTQNP